MTFTTQLNINSEVYHDTEYHISYRCAVTTESTDAWDTTVLSMSTNGSNYLTKGVMIMVRIKHGTST
jgi:hypothetical protein